MWSNYNACKAVKKETPAELFAPCQHQNYLVFSIDSDFCFYPEEQRDLTKQLEDNNISTMHITVHSEKGHDSFLLEPELYCPHISYALNK